MIVRADPRGISREVPGELPGSRTRKRCSGNFYFNERARELHQPKTHFQ
jgi:hypothetical protein